MKNNGKTLRKVSEIVEELNSAENRTRIMNSRQERLRSLTLKYDIEIVALAAGYTVSTLSQHLRVKNPPSIGEEAVSQAEYVLQKIK